MEFSASLRSMASSGTRMRIIFLVLSPCWGDLRFGLRVGKQKGGDCSRHAGRARKTGLVLEERSCMYM